MRTMLTSPGLTTGEALPHHPDDGRPAPVAEQQLPAAMVGDAARPVERRHGVRGWLYIGFCYLLALLLVLIPLSAVSEGSVGDLRSPLLLLLAPVLAVLHWRLAGEVRRFTSWGWYGAMIELATLVMLKVGSAIAEGFGPAVGLVMSVIELAWMWYFWNRRAQFDVDLGS
ncbi:MAG TPA: hypothetical protein VEQ60_04125 [Longimicrobium sp.]|nr:hypothetical protein [Longimicrobium sp.]